MTELLTNIEALIAMYAPIVLSMLIQLSNFIIVWKKLKTIKVKEDIDSSLTELNENMKQLVADNAELRKANKKLMEQLTKVIEDEELNQN